MTPRGLVIAGALVFVLAMVFDMARPDRAATDGPFVKAEIVTVTYDIVGDDLADLERQMEWKGPGGYWAYARTNWEWDAQCNMTFRARVTMPKLVSRHRLDQAELAEWDRMFAALEAHEMGHIEIGKAWASAIKAAGCRDSDRIDAQWRDEDGEYDRRTNHGRLEGVYLVKP